MIRHAAALLLTASAALAQADDPALPVLPPMNSQPTPIADPGPSLGAPANSESYAAPATTYSASPTYSSSPQYGSGSGFVSEQPLPTQYPVQSEYPLHTEYPIQSGPIVSHSPPVYSEAPYSAAPGAGCACQSGATVYSGSSLGMPAGDLGMVSGGFTGYQAMGYHGGGMETYTGAVGGGMHVRHPYYSYRRPWYANGPMSHNVNIAW